MRRRYVLVSDAARQAADDPGEVLALQEALTLALTRLARAHAPYARVFVGHYHLGETQAELAAAFGLSNARIGAMAHQAASILASYSCIQDYRFRERRERPQPSPTSPPVEVNRSMLGRPAPEVDPYANPPPKEAPLNGGFLCSRCRMPFERWRDADAHARTAHGKKRVALGRFCPSMRCGAVIWTFPWCSRCSAFVLEPVADHFGTPPTTTDQLRERKP